jgi:hypothetical protein
VGLSASLPGRFTDLASPAAPLASVASTHPLGSVVGGDTSGLQLKFRSGVHVFTTAVHVDVARTEQPVQRTPRSASPDPARG